MHLYGNTTPLLGGEYVHLVDLRSQRLEVMVADEDDLKAQGL
jgi:hypothetical protein